MALWNRLQGTWKRREVEARLDDELQFHLDMRTDELIAQGHTEAEARAMARRQLGNAAKLREEAREVDMLLWIENWGRDIKLAIRSLIKRPVFTLTAILSLAVGIGAVTSLFSVVDAVIWKPVALPAADELVFVDEYKNGNKTGSNGPRLRDWQTLSSFSSATGYYGDSVVWKGPNGAESLRALRVYTKGTPTFRLSPIAGRAFTPEEEAGERVVMLSENFWRKRFNASPQIADQTLQIDGQSYAIAGVLPASISIQHEVELWLPADRGLQKGNRKSGYLGIIGRLKPGITREQAQAEANILVTRMQKENPESDTGLQAALISVSEELSREARTPLLLLFGVVCCVLLMIAVNLSALLLARANERERESGLRSALGASTASLVRLYLSETFLLAFVGASIGLLLSLSGVDLLKALLPQGISRLDQATVDLRVLGCGLGLAFAVALIAGLVPSWMAARGASIRDDGRTTASKHGLWIRSGFVIAEIALGLLLVTTAVRIAETFATVSERSRAIQTAQKIAVTVPFSWTDPNERVTGFNRQALERFASLPGVTSVGLIDRLPLGGGTQSGEIEISGVSAAAPMDCGRRSASSSYFSTMGIPVLRGRLFEDRAGRQEVVVNESFARKFLNGADPVGKKIKFNRNKEWLEIVGMVGNIRQQVEQREAQPEMFLFYADGGWPLSNFVIRSTAPVGVLAPMIRQEVGRLDSMVVIDRLASLDEALGEATSTPRIRSYLIGSFALVALFLAAVGIHGLFAADVARRWKEFGIRLALGGSVSALRNLLLKRAAMLLAAGSALGIAAVVATSKLLESAVEGLQPARILTAVVVALLILVAALAAIWWPLRKLSGVDPAAALRHE